MKKTIISLAALAGIAATGSAFAQSLEFGSLDADGNGSISMEELQVAIPDLNDETFGLLDTDADGAITEEEFAALLPAEQAPANTMEAPADSMGAPADPMAPAAPTAPADPMAAPPAAQ